ncbi:lactoylglutathione lyase [Deinococcus malanensis]|uniref:Lactoylglutathione lyase n=1 Tax=Deinococcus malanensis TaxID=1706855 RepID=A0ABQ2EUM5_9DEIO|nr:VOC family protein [Deinococcus malanensis]GGK26343.1 lactoylglutathione lyase [Deinococcus malanensis]
MLLDLAHVALKVHDLQQSLDFYTRLGLREAFRLHHDDGSLMLVYLHAGGDRFVELFPGGEAPAGSPRQGSFMHLCLRVDDLHATVETLEQQGVPIDVQPKVGLDRNWQAWVTDPDGNAVELMQLDETSPQRRVARGETPHGPQ